MTNAFSVTRDSHNVRVMKLAILILIIIFGTSLPVSSELSGILKTCRDECQRSQSEEEYFSSEKYKSKLYRFMSAGFASLFWDAIHEGNIKSKHEISQDCFRDLMSISAGLIEGKTWAYQCKFGRQSAN